MIIYSAASSALKGVQNLTLSLWLSLYLRTHTHSFTMIMNLHKHWLAHKNVWAHRSTHSHHIQYSSTLFQSSLFLFICNVQNKTTHWAGFTRPANQKLNRTFVITIALYLSIIQNTFKTIPSHSCLCFCNHFRSNAQKCFIMNQEWGGIKKRGWEVGWMRDSGREGRDELVDFYSPVPNCCFRMCMQKGGISLII